MVKIGSWPFRWRLKKHERDTEARERWPDLARNLGDVEPQACCEVDNPAQPKARCWSILCEKAAR
jgi:hypothetical protein